VCENILSFSQRSSSSEAASRIKARVRKTDSRCERLLRSKLWGRGLRYRKNLASLPGCPDIVFQRARIAIFCDGDFWHGRDWNARRERLEGGSNGEYWIAKIERNIRRAVEVEELLRGLGWRVIRVWESDILAHCDEIAERLFSLLG
jgi:DNA mismatch endonuclease (patch repair protein)